jgi:hypothetical protein
MASNYTTAKEWETLTDATRTPFKKWIADLVGYQCKVACQENTVGSMDIIVFNIKKGCITDWLELQPSGAIGVIFEEYEEPMPDHVDALSDRCEDYNEKIGVCFEESDSESESESESEEESDGESDSGKNEGTK